MKYKKLTGCLLIHCNTILLFILNRTNTRLSLSVLVCVCFDGLIDVLMDQGLHKCGNKVIFKMKVFIFYAGMEAKQVFEDAQRLLKVIISSGSLKGHGLVGFWPARSSGDDIDVYNEDVSVVRGTKPIATFHCLRQQVRLSSGLGILSHFLGDANTSGIFPYSWRRTAPFPNHIYVCLTSLRLWTVACRITLACLPWAYLELRS